MSDLYLIHHGIKGQKHGVRNAEWYPIDAYKAHLRNTGYSEESIKKITNKIDKGKSTYSIKREIKKQTKLKNKNGNTNETKPNKYSSMSPEEAKKEALNRADLKYVKEHYMDFTTSEINEAINRKAALTKLKDLTSEDKENGQKSIDKMKSTLGTVQDITGKVSGTAGNVLKFYNSVNAIQNLKNKNAKDKNNNNNKK